MDFCVISGGTHGERDLQPMSYLVKLLILSATLTLVACQAQTVRRQTVPKEEPSAAFVGAPEPTRAPAAPNVIPPPPTFTKGTVVETMDSGGYTYICIENAGQKRWVAMPATQVEVGQEVEIGGGMEMHNFTSKTLGRTFEAITFCGGLVEPKADAASAPAARGGLPPGHVAVPGTLPSGHPGMPSGRGAPAAGQAPQSEKASSSKIAGKVVETMDAGGYTYAAVEKDGQRNWVAIPPTQLSVGQEVEFVPGFVMNNFNSKTLNRTFESITFSSGVVESQ